MKKKQGLRWGAMLGSGLNKGEMNEKLVTVGAAMLFDVVCAFFFLYSSASMLLEEFQLLKFGIGFYVKQLLLILFISAVMELAGHLKKLQEIGLKLAILLSGIFWIVWHLRKEKVWEEITSGLWSVGSVYLKEWNYYYDTSWYCPPGMALYATDSVEFVLLMVGLLLFWLAKCCKKNTVMAVVPVLIIIAELLVGNSPAGRGIFCVFAGILLAGNQSFSIPDFKLSEKHKGKAGKVHLFGWLPSVVVLSLLCMTVFLMGRKSAEEIVTTHAGELEDLIMNTANKVADWEFWRTIEDPGGVENMVDGVLGTIDFDRETLDNSEPVFEDIPVLRMTVERKPEGQIYLKGFYADTYENSVWKKNADEFEQACREAGFEFEDVAEELARLGVIKQIEHYNAKKLSQSDYGLDASVFYYDSNTIKAYLPYFIEKNGNEISVDGESNYKKRKSDEELNFVLWQYGHSYETQLRTFYYGKSRNWERWYEKYVKETYLAVPENMSNVENIAAELLKADFSNTKLGEIDSTNEERLAKAYVVADWLARNTSYSTILPELSRGTDPVEYFLGTTRNGYCMHYASAAVLLLRAMDVPARYASGYVVSRNSFTNEMEGYVAEVLDNCAHAWAEIYLNGIGWVPVEVTYGYSELLPTPTPSPTPTNAPTNSPTPTPTMPPVPTPTEVPVDVTVIPILTGTPIPTEGGETLATPTAGPEGEILLVSPTIIPAGIATPTPTVTPTPILPEVIPEEQSGITITPSIESIPEENSPMPTSLPESILPEEETEWFDIAIQVMLVLIVAFVICMIVFSPAAMVHKFFRFEKAYHRKLLWTMKRGGNARAIKMVNRSIYRKLRFNNIIKAGCTDKQYEQALKEHFSVLWPEEWDRYMEIVKAAEFSLREFTDEEVEFCYKIYRDIIY